MKALNRLGSAGLIMLVSLLLAGCGGSSSGSAESANPPEDTSPTPAKVVIPTVFHVLYYNDFPESNPSDEKVKSQLAPLNDLFRARSEDLDNVPDMFKPFIADMEIEFELATVDPEGNPTTGITRTLATPEPNPEDAWAFVYYTNAGGIDAWPTNKYLNIWVLDMRERNGGTPIAGRASLPGWPADEDGVLIATTALGTIEPLADGLNMGKTLAHEVGHWLGLKHIAGEQTGTCNVDDDVADTPLTDTNYALNPTHPVSSCGSVDMFMNVMALTSDRSLLMFTEGQKQRIWQVLGPGGEREELVTQFKNR